MDNWKECTQTCRGTMSRRLLVNFQMGLGHEGYDEALGASASHHRFSEINQRGFYRRWAQLMGLGSPAAPRGYDAPALYFEPPRNLNGSISR